MSTVPGFDDERNKQPAPFPIVLRRPRLSAPPTHLTPLLGRDRELAEVSTLLATGNVRLVTLIGPGGIGKTRLAGGIANRLAATFNGQVAWVPVATATTPESVAVAIAHAVGVTETGGEPVLDMLRLALRDARLLLVVDNFEQALDAAPLLSDLLVSCPGVSLLVTSRALLRLQGEHPIDVSPLAVAPKGSGATAGEEAAPAVRLFAERAAGVVPGFELTNESVALVTDICRRLDGLPLAIELAAARVNHLSLPELRDRLNRRLMLLTVAERGAPSRHRTMRDAIAWSYDLLGADQQRLFRSLAPFAGGFTVEAIEAVAPDLPDVLSALGVLVDNSLVRLESSSQYTMLETVREFAVEQLATSGEDDISRQRHAGYYLELARRWYRTYWGDEPGDPRDWVRAEEANLRVAADWAIAQGDVEMATRLVVAMFDPLSHTGDHAREQFLWLRRALALPGGSPAGRAFALARCAAVVRFDQLHEGEAMAEEALMLARQCDDAFVIAEALQVLGNLAIHTGEIDRARELLLEALVRFRDLGRQGRVGWTLHHLSALEGVGADPDPLLAATYCDEALAIFHELGHVRGVEATLSWHSECAYKLGDLPKALASAREGLSVTMSGVWAYDAFDRIADVAGRVGSAETAARLYGVADELRENAHRPIEPAFRAAHEARIDVARQVLGRAAFEDAYDAGRALTVEQAVAEAMSVEIPPETTPTAAVDPGSTVLSPRELEVMRLLANGYSDRAIAEALFIGRRTVNTHVAHIFEKLGVNSRAAAVTAAVAAGLVDPDAVRPDPR